MVRSLSVWGRLRRRQSLASRPPRRQPLSVEALEDRLTPAFNLNISNAATVNVTNALNAGIRTFTASATGANLNVADIKTALLANEDVVITTGTAGAQTGNISWAAGNLDVQGIATANLSLSLLPDASSTTGDITVGANIFDSVAGDGELLDVVFQSAANGDVNLTGSALTAVQDVTVNAGVNNAILGNINSQGNQTITGATITLQNATHTSVGDQTYTGAVTLPANRTVTSTAGNLAFTGDINGTAANTLILNALAGNVILQGIGAGGQIADLDVNAGAITINGDITLVDGAAARQLSFNGSVITAGNRIFNLAGVTMGSSVRFGGDTTLGGNLTVTLASAANAVTSAQGTFNAGANAVTTNGIFNVGDGTAAVTYAGTGQLNAANSVVVNNLGRLAPGGDGTTGNLAVTTGAVNFQAGGVLDIDLQGPDVLNVTGAININAAAILDGDGTMPAAGPSTIVTGTAIAGTFAGTVGNPFVLGEDAVTATYSPINLMITQVAAGPNTVTGLTNNADKYTIKKTGPGQLVVIDIAGDPGIEGIVIRDATTTTKLSITITPNGGPGTETVEALRVDGSIGSVTAATTDFIGDHRVSGLLTSLKARNLVGALTGGGTAAQKTTLTGRQFSGDIALTSKLNVLTVNDYTGGSISAPTIGTVTTTANTAAGLAGNFTVNLTLDAGNAAATALSKATIAGSIFGGIWDIRGKVGTVTIKNSANGWTLGTTGTGNEHPDQLGTVTKVAITGQMSSSTINSIGRVATLTAANWTNTNLRAQSIGTFKSTRNTSLNLAGDLSSSIITITGAANPGQVALTTFVATGLVQNSTFNVLAGNVTSFTAGKFLSSNLYVGYIPAGNISSAGTFTGNFKISTFKTTATPIVPGVSDPATDAFQDSEVASSRVGTVRLSGVTVNNGGTTFGFRVAAVAGNVGSFRIATNPFVANVNYTPSASGAVVPAVIGQVDFGFFV